MERNIGERRNIRLTIAYDGTAYSGWQIQPRVPTVQGVLERVLEQLTQHPCRLRAAGRTDAGVHAEGQVASFRSETRLSCKKLLGGVNALTPADIAVRRVEDVALDFDARRHVDGKHYRYTVFNGSLLPPQLRCRAYHVRRPLDLPAMARAAQRFVGTHDFAAFRAADCERETTRRTLYRCSVSRGGGSLVTIDVEGTAFLKHMVRIMSGTLIEIGRGRVDEALIARLLSRGDRTEAGPTARASGLVLVEVFLR